MASKPDAAIARLVQWVSSPFAIAFTPGVAADIRALILAVRPGTRFPKPPARAAVEAAIRDRGD